MQPDVSGEKRGVLALEVLYGRQRRGEGRLVELPGHGAEFPQWLESVADLGEPQPIDWLLRPLLPANVIGVCYGPPGGGKTLIVLDWALQVADGGLGVVYVAGEGGDGMVNRVAAWRALHEHEALGRYYVVRRAFSLIDDADVDELCRGVRAVAERAGGLGLVVVDTLSQAIPGGDENLQATMTLALAACKDVRDAAGGATVLLVHHTNKQNELRGSSVLRGNCDTIFRVGQAEGDTRHYELTIEKQKDGRTDIGPFLYKRDIVQFDERGEVTGATVRRQHDPALRVEAVRVSERRRLVLDAVAEALAAGATVTRAGLMRCSGVPQRRVGEVLEWAVSIGLLDQADDTYRPGPGWESWLALWTGEDDEEGELEL